MKYTKKWPICSNTDRSFQDRFFGVPPLRKSEKGEKANRTEKEYIQKARAIDLMLDELELDANELVLIHDKVSVRLIEEWGIVV